MSDRDRKCRVEIYGNPSEIIEDIDKKRITNISLNHGICPQCYRSLINPLYDAGMLCPWCGTLYCNQDELGIVIYKAIRVRWIGEAVYNEYGELSNVS